FLPYTGLLQVVAGGDHTCALQADGGPFCWGANDSGQIGDTTTTERRAPVSLPSFTLNIDPAVLLSRNSRVTTVNIVATCAAGGHLLVNVTLSQGAVSGSGSGQGDCTGKLEKYPVTVPAQGSDGFTAGPARLDAEG